MKKNLFEHRVKYTLPEITKILGDAISQIKKLNVLTIDRKIHIASMKNFDLNVEVFFDTNGVHGEYTVLDLKVINTKTQVSTNHLRILFTDKKYGTSTDKKYGTSCISSLRGGHYWLETNEFYAYVPDFNIILSEIKSYLLFMGILI